MTAYKVTFYKSINAYKTTVITVNANSKLDAKLKAMLELFRLDSKLFYNSDFTNKNVFISLN